MQVRHAAAGVLLVALVLAGVEFWFGMRTDEAKYLLNIPYPHPPFLRSIFGWTDGWMFQEFLWRLVLSIALIAAGLLFRPIGFSLWLTAPAVLFGAGTVMLAPVTAMVACTALWLLSLPKDRLPHSAWIALLWMTALFAAYQNLLLAPLFFALLRRSGIGWLPSKIVLGVPLILLALYTISNPLAAASFVLQGTKDVELTLLARVLNVGHLWLLGGGVLGAVVGIAGIIRTRNPWIILSFALFTAYVLLGSFPYYAVFFTPFFAYGVTQFRLGKTMQIVIMISGLLTTVWLWPRPFTSSARSVVAVVMQEYRPTAIVIDGSFGHEWQYESPVPVLRYSATLEIPSRAIVLCLAACVVPAYGEELSVPGIHNAWGNQTL